MIIVVTGLKLKSPLGWSVFAWHAMRSFSQAERADGAVSVSARRVGGYHHTVTAWRDGASMKAFAKSGAHKRAEAVFSTIATGRIAIYEADTEPSWDEAVAIWQQIGRDV